MVLTFILSPLKLLMSVVKILKRILFPLFFISLLPVSQSWFDFQNQTLTSCAKKEEELVDIRSGSHDDDRKSGRSSLSGVSSFSHSPLQECKWIWIEPSGSFCCVSSLLSSKMMRRNSSGPKGLFISVRHVPHAAG